MIKSVAQVLALMQKNGATRFYAKRLAPNDNSKNQIYLGDDFSALNILPYKEIRVDADHAAGSKLERAKADVSLYWLNEDGCYDAPAAQLILYPKYPEVRLSGFLRGCRNAPTEIMTVRDDGRVLVLGITPPGRILGYAAGADHPVAKEILGNSELRPTGVFLDLTPELRGDDSRAILIAKLSEISRKLWIPSQKLGTDGIARPYRARNGGGYTLEAELGISPNGYSEPDYLGWEVKQYGVRDFTSYSPKSPITLMTPEPTAGIYRDEGVAAFIRRFGYADTSGTPDRINVGGIYNCTGDFHTRTGLGLEIRGIDSVSQKITDMHGGIALVSRSGDIAALWAFSKIIEHWSRKHAKAVYVPSLHKKPPPQYRYGPKILLCEETDFSLFLKSLIAGNVYYDPGIKMEQSSSGHPTIKRRSQFRVSHKRLGDLYQRQELITLDPGI